MALQAHLNAQFVASPSTISDSQFPSGVTSITFGLNPPVKQFSLDTGVMRVTVNSPASYITLEGVGTNGVTQATTFFIRTQVQMLVRMTFANPAGGADIVSISPINGVKLAEFPANGYLKLLEVQGQGQVEYYASGLI